MTAITALGLALFMTVLVFRMRGAARHRPSSARARLKTARLLIAAAVAWIAIGMHLARLNRALGGEPRAPRSTWERVIDAVTDLGP